MWKSETGNLESYLAESSTIRSRSLITAEWNLNIAENINELGNYRFRPNDEDSAFYVPAPTFVSETALSSVKKYYGATDSDIVLDGGLTDDNEPQIFTSPNKKMKSLYSLEDCLGRFRPRSGINKVLYFDGKFFNRVNPDMAKQPRFYFGSPDDKFKYWTSFRTEPKATTISGTPSKVYASTVNSNGDYFTKIKIANNKFKKDDYVSISGISNSTITDLNGSFVVVSASSTAIKVRGNFCPSTTTTGLSGASVTSTRQYSVNRGVSYRSGTDYLIDDAAPFVTYKTSVPANRIVVKMQTKVGEIDLGPYTDENGISFEDPFFDKDGNRIKAVPKKWKVQTLSSSRVWTTAYDFAQNPYDIPSHGHVELAYGLIVPEAVGEGDYELTSLRDVFTYAGEVGSSSALPVAAPVGYSYLVTSPSGPGTFYVSVGTVNETKNSNYVSFPAEYGWYVNDSETPTNISSFVTDFTSPESFVSGSTTAYRDFQNILGLRIVVESMESDSSTFDLIEMSPRLAADITDMTTSVSVTKHASDLGSSGMPVGQLLASTGSLDLFDYDQSFNSNNENSIIKNLSTKNLQIKIFEKIYPNDGMMYVIPIKTMYADGFPDISNSDRSVSIKIRDLFFYFESMKAPELIIPNCSLSMAVSCLMDSVGFSNYTFKRVSSKEYVIPYFFVGPDKTVAEALEDLAVSTQTAMFLDEYNNLVLMDKEYMMPVSESSRATDMTLYGDSTGLANIMDIESADDEVYNDGKISYETKYIQRSYASLAQAGVVDSEKTWIYKPVLLWEVSPEENTKSWNDESSKQSSYTLSAIPLDSDLSSDLPVVESGVIINNTMDLGEAVYWLSRYNGHFYANGEIIKFDAVQYNVPTKQVDGFRGTGESGKKTIIVKKIDGLERLKKGYMFIGNDAFLDNTKIDDIDISNGVIALSQPLSRNISLETFSIRASTSNVWVSDAEEYQKYFADVPFGGKIYPTGLVRIYAEPFYDDALNSLKEGKVAKHGRGQFGTSIVSHGAGVGSTWTNENSLKTIYMKHSYMFNGGEIPATYQNVKAGVLTTAEAAKIGKASTNGIIKNFMSSRNITETSSNKLDTTNPGTVQSSALVMDGPSYPSGYNPQSFVQYAYKSLEDRFTHVSTRMRIIGSMEDEKLKLQTAVGTTPYYKIGNKNIGGSSGGIGMWVDPTTNCGYYFEIVALTETESNAYSSTAEAINTLFFYKIQADKDGVAIPIVLWSGLANILVDDGRFTGQGRQTIEKNTTVYDVAIEVEKTKAGNAVFSLFLNDQLVGTAKDTDPLDQRSNLALFVRGSTRAMFENVVAIANNVSKDPSQTLNAPVKDAFGLDNTNLSTSARKYALSGALRTTMLDGVTKSNEPKYNVYFEEFGTIMRECAYFDIKYDKAYPALYAKMSPTFNNNQGYSVSGFTATAYGAQFLIFNVTDTVLSLDSGSGNHLRIQGVTFTQNSRHELTVDEYFSKQGDLSDPDYRNGKVYNDDYQEAYLDIKKNRLTYGTKSFTINAPYIQSQASAQDLMRWLTGKIMQPRKAVGLEILSMPHLQLGDIVKVQYSKDGIRQVSDEDSSRYVVYSIEYTRDTDGSSMKIYLSEVK